MPPRKAVAVQVPAVVDVVPAVPAEAPVEPTKPAALDRVIPWDTPGVDPTLKVLMGSTPIRFQGLGYAHQDGLHITEIFASRRR